MAGSLQPRIKVWTSTEDVTAVDLNAEFDNVLQAMQPLLMDDYSTNTAQMQVTTDPGEVGTESLATTLAAEVARLRFAIQEIKGDVPQWYSSADTSLNELGTVLGGGLVSNRITSGATSATSDQPLFLDPAGTSGGLAVTLDGTPTAFTYSIEGTTYSIATDVTVNTLVAAPATNNTALVNDASLVADPEHSKMLGEHGSVIYIDNVGSEISSLIGKLAAFSITNGAQTEYFIARVASDRLYECRRGYFFNSSGVSVPRIAFTDNDTITLLKLTWLYANTASTLTVAYNNPTVSFDQPNSPAIGDYWFDIGQDKWRYFNSTIWVDADATLIGICAQTTADCVGVRAFDFFRNYAELNTVSIERASATTVTMKGVGSLVNVYGNTIRFLYFRPSWDISTDLASGLTEAASTVYFLYLTEDGDRIIDVIPPYDRRTDLFGLYHPSETWRCVGQFFNNASSDIEAVLDYSDMTEKNYAISTSVAASAMTVRLHASPIVKFHMRDPASAAVKGILPVQYPYMQTLVIPSTATMGHRNATAEPLYPYLVANGVNLELAVSTSGFEDDQIVPTTALGTGSDDEDIFSAAARASVSVKRFGRIEVNNTTAGTWAADATGILPYGKIRIRRLTTTSSGSQDVTSASLTDVTNQTITMHTTGRPVAIGSFNETDPAYFAMADQGSGSASGEFALVRDATTVVLTSLELTNAINTYMTNMGTALHGLDTGATNGSHTFKTQMRATSAGSDFARANAVKMYVYETLPE